MKVHTNEKTLNLKKDVKTHSYGNPYQCTLCDKCFINEKELKIHIKDTHTGEKSFQFTHCDKTFSYESKLNYHMITHTGEYKYNCSYCEKSYLRNQDLEWTDI